MLVTAHVTEVMRIMLDGGIVRKLVYLILRIYWKYNQLNFNGLKYDRLLKMTKKHVLTVLFWGKYLT